MGWLSRWFGSQPPPAPLAGAGAASIPASPAGAGAAPTPAAPAAPAPAAAADAAASVFAVEQGAPFLPWLLDTSDPLRPGITDLERQALKAVDRVLAQPALPLELLPRAANVVPQLIAMLRQDDLPVQVLADRIGKDPALAAEVLRMAGTSFYRQAGPVQDLPQAIQRLGIEGLQMAISRVVLRPLYQARSGSLTAVVAPRLWTHADVLARHSALAARGVGQSAFDGYLVGLLHDTGWTVLFHALQRSGLTSLGAGSVEGAAGLEQRAHRLFGRAAESWRITPAFTAFAVDAQRTDLAASHDPLGAALRAAQGLCMDELLTAA